MLVEALNELMEHIEQQLTEEISDSDITKITGLSAHHFKRMFTYMSGITLTTYIRNRRLSIANEELIHGSSVTDVAFRYGYHSIEGFSRAFREWSGFLPSEVMKNHIQKSFPRFTFYIDIKGGTSMEFKIEEKDAFQIVGVSKRVPIQFEGINQEIVALAQSISEQQRMHMREMGNLYPNHVLNASFNFDDGHLEEEGYLTHMIGFATTREDVYDDLEQILIPKSLWAVFPNCGPFPQTLQETMAKTYAEWLPSSGYELQDLPGITFSKIEMGYENVYSEVWVPIKSKEDKQT